jgi:N-acetylglucosamine kinase-like BadF-type ATPase
MKEAIILAVDGGGTGCRAAICNQDGQILVYAQGDSCNYHSIGIEMATENLLGLFNSLIKKQVFQINYVVLGLAGLDTKRDEAVLTRMVDQALAAANITADSIYLCNDAMLTLKGSVGQNNGVLLAVGTGSIACGITKEGLETRVGGWGYRVGDEGSGYSIGKAAITHVLKSYDGREKHSDISEAILKQLSLHDEDALINWVYGSHFSVAQIAALAPIIVSLAESGDHQSQQIVQHACRELEIMLLTVIRKLGLLDAEFSLVLSGGVLKNQLVHRQLIQHLAGICPGLQLTELNCQPICAALRHGLVMMGYDNNTLLNQLSLQLTTFSNRPES